MIHKDMIHKWIPFVVYLGVFLSVTAPLHAQWRSEGIPLDPDYGLWWWTVVPDDIGGVWVAWSRPYEFRNGPQN